MFFMYVSIEYVLNVMFLLNVYSMLCLCCIYGFVECVMNLMFILYFLLNVFSMLNVYVVQFYFVEGWVHLSSTI
jgi:hypothetical protein